MSQSALAQSTVTTVHEAARACGLDDDAVRLVAVTAVGPSDRRALEAAVTGMVGRPCRSTLTEILDIEVDGARVRVGIAGGAGDRAPIERALRRSC